MDNRLLNHVKAHILEADKAFAAPCMVLKDDEATAYAKAAIEAISSYLLPSCGIVTFSIKGDKGTYASLEEWIIGEREHG